MRMKISDRAIALVPELSGKISLFTRKHQISHSASGTVKDYCHAIYKSVLVIGKLPEEYTQEDVDGYMNSMLDTGSDSQFRHFVYGLKSYRKLMEAPELRNLTMPKISVARNCPW